jgi:hypothetical protein
MSSEPPWCTPGAIFFAPSERRTVGGGRLRLHPGSGSGSGLVGSSSRGCHVCTHGHRLYRRKGRSGIFRRAHRFAVRKPPRPHVAGNGAQRRGECPPFWRAECLEAGVGKHASSNISGRREFWLKGSNFQLWHSATGRDGLYQMSAVRWDRISGAAKRPVMSCYFKERALVVPIPKVLAIFAKGRAAELGTVGA